jgi:hypothetical protein
LAGKGLQEGIGRFGKGELAEDIREVGDLRGKLSKGISEYTGHFGSLGEELGEARDMSKLLSPLYTGREAIVIDGLAGIRGIGGPQMLGAALATGGLAGTGAMGLARKRRARKEENRR